MWLVWPSLSALPARPRAQSGPFSGPKVEGCQDHVALGRGGDRSAVPSELPVILKEPHQNNKFDGRNENNMDNEANSSNRDDNSSSRIHGTSIH